MIPAAEINRIIVRQLERHKLEYECNFDPNWNHQEVIYCYDEKLITHEIFEDCSGDELTTLFTALLENRPMDWNIVLEIAKLLPAKGGLVKKRLEDYIFRSEFDYDNRMLLLAYLGSNPKYEKRIIELLDTIPEDFRDGLFLACEALNTPVICRKLMEKFTQWITANPDYGCDGTGEGQYLHCFLELWQHSQPSELCGNFIAFCRKNWHDRRR